MPPTPRRHGNSVEQSCELATEPQLHPVHREPHGPPLRPLLEAQEDSYLPREAQHWELLREQAP